jgi:hypothetical protein
MATKPDDDTSSLPAAPAPVNPGSVPPEGGQKPALSDPAPSSSTPVFRGEITDLPSPVSLATRRARECFQAARTAEELCEDLLQLLEIARVQEDHEYAAQLRTWLNLAARIELALKRPQDAASVLEYGREHDGPAAAVAPTASSTLPSPEDVLTDPACAACGSTEPRSLKASKQPAGAQPTEPNAGDVFNEPFEIEAGRKVELDVEPCTRSIELFNSATQSTIAVGASLRGEKLTIVLRPRSTEASLGVLAAAAGGFILGHVLGGGSIFIRSGLPGRPGENIEIGRDEFFAWEKAGKPQPAATWLEQHRRERSRGLA